MEVFTTIKHWYTVYLLNVWWTRWCCSYTWLIISNVDAFQTVVHLSIGNSGMGGNSFFSVSIHAFFFCHLNLDSHELLPIAKHYYAHLCCLSFFRVLLYFDWWNTELEWWTLWWFVFRNITAIKLLHSYVVCFYCF